MRIFRFLSWLSHTVWAHFLPGSLSAFRPLCLCLQPRLPEGIKSLISCQKIVWNQYCGSRIVKHSCRWTGAGIAHWGASLVMITPNASVFTNPMSLFLPSNLKSCFFLALIISQPCWYIFSKAGVHTHFQEIFPEDPPADFGNYLNNPRLYTYLGL